MINLELFPKILSRLLKTIIQLFNHRLNNNIGTC
jgi:hypothetical protein